MYKAPVEDIIFTLKHVAGLKDAMDKGLMGDLSEDLLDAIITEAGRFATEEMAPLAEIGDKQGARLVDGSVKTPDGWPKLYKSWSEGGWNSVAAPAEYGGQELPWSIGAATFELWSACTLGFAVGPGLTIGAIEAINAHASPELKEKYLPNMISGQWMGAMALTEPGAGTDLGVMKSRAEPRADGTYRIFGQKIFITYGDHDFTDNVVHLVLAKLPGAPAGSRGISLFLVPKFLVNEDGSLGARNDFFCHSLEEKLGIHGSPTCTMIYGDGKYGDEPGAIGWLVGEENKGLAAMFTMMNNMRLDVGLQGVGIGDAATQKAIEYAKERLQGRAPGWTGEGMSPIIEHPDVARMLLTMKAQVQGSRAITYITAFAIDMANSTEGDEKTYWQERANLLTPIAKSFPTDMGVEVASTGIQVHGGMGFVEETGAARYYRDARIAPIYEGTNGVQAVDLVGRKLPQSGGEHVRGFIAELKEIAEQVRGSNKPGFGNTADKLDASLQDLEDAVEWTLSALADGKMAEALAGATPLQRLFGLTLCGVYLAKGGLADVDDGGQEKRIALCRFAAENLISETSALKDRIIGGSDALAAARAVLA
ncbi:acyl-CoA dehydrogenase [Rhizobium sp. L1K21]|uniref:acyl-CoA dehydrogenase n=1 Tax=Rhizobium sp. L1K21 TaxID=2954933 RepID=UPI0020920F4E|nr:acyl-CoA dehydrogenase [Rhizobium sp. L1K21]MCO6186891.1 acyl-CoA dehydrogenase [Rhizobium sp. L1K21]